MGDLEVGLRLTRLEAGNFDDLDCGSGQLLLAPAVQHQLGARIIYAGAASGAGSCLSDGVPHRRAAVDLFSDARRLKSMVWDKQRKPKVPPLRFAPVGMTKT